MTEAPNPDGAIRKSKTKIFLVTLVVAIAALIIGFNYLGPIISGAVETIAPPILKAPVTPKTVSVSPLSGEGELKGLVVGNPDGFKTDYAFSLDQVKVSLDVKSVTTDKIIVREVIIDSPSIIFEGSLTNSNISQLITNINEFVSREESNAQPSSTTTEEAGVTPAQETKSGKSIQIDLLEIRGAQASLSMTLLGGKKMTVSLPTITITDIGKEDDTSIAQAVQQVMGEMYKALLPAIQKTITNVGGALLDGGGKVGSELEKGAKDIGKSLKGLFSK